MNTQDTGWLLVLSITSLLMLTVSLLMAWSVLRQVRRLVGRLGDNMEGLLRKQTEALQEVAGVTNGGTARIETVEPPPAAESDQLSAC
jgi:hypothetical protein